MIGWLVDWLGVNPEVIRDGGEREPQGSRNCHLTLTRLTHYARWRVRCVFRWEMLAALIGVGIIDLQTPTYTKPPESPSNDTKS